MPRRLAQAVQAAQAVRAPQETQAARAAVPPGLLRETHMF